MAFMICGIENSNPLLSKTQPGESSKRLLHDYLVSASENDLSLGVRFFEHLKETQNTEIITDLEEVMKLALDCIYACKDSGMYEKATAIFECIPVSSEDGLIVKSTEIQNEIEELEQELECLKVLNKYNVKTNLSYIRENKRKAEIVKMLLIQMARNVK